MGVGVQCATSLSGQELIKATMQVVIEGWVKWIGSKRLIAVSSSGPIWPLPTRQSSLGGADL